MSRFVILRLQLCFVCLWLLWLTTATGCAGQQFTGTVYESDDLHFRVDPPPESWRRIDVSDALFAYRDDVARATIAVNARCGKDAADVPLESLTQHLFIYFTDRNIKQQRRLPMDGREAMRTEIVAELDGVPKAFVVYVLKKDRCVYDFLYISDPDTIDVDARRFDRYVASFRTLPR
ncbi:MAG: hypothetical protein ACOC1F_14360 [Myxococcota bacterium]